MKVEKETKTVLACSNDQYGGKKEASGKERDLNGRKIKINGIKRKRLKKKLGKIAIKIHRFQVEQSVQEVGKSKTSLQKKC